MGTITTRFDNGQTVFTIDECKIVEGVINEISITSEKTSYYIRDNEGNYYLRTNCQIFTSRESLIKQL